MNTQTKDIEANILNCLLYDRQGINELAAFLATHHFSNSIHKAVAECIWNLFDDGGKIDILTVKQTLQKKGYFSVFKYEEITACLEAVSKSFSNDVWKDAHILIQEAIRRDVVALANTVNEMAYSETGDAQSVLDFYEQGLLEIAAANIHHDADIISKILPEAVKAFKTHSTVLPTGIKKIDDIIVGLSPGELTIIAARPSTGKSAFALNIAKKYAASIRRIPVAIFSLEMTANQLVNRLLSEETGIDLSSFTSGKLNDVDWHRLVTTNIASAPIYIDDTPALPVFELRARVRRMIAELGVGLVIIDYLQLLNPGTKKFQNREQQISFISRMLKVMCKSFNIPIIALSQLTRDLESRTDKRPKLYDLRESGSLEQHADMVWLMYRPELYGIEYDDEGNSTKDTTEVIIGKNRNGNIGTAVLQFKTSVMRFT